MTNPEVENSIRHWWMLLHRPIPCTVRVGPVRLAVKYESQPGSCYKCGSFGHSPAQCQNLVCHYCGEVGHRVAECRARQRKCTFCGSREHLTNQCPIANQDLNYQSLERDDFPEATSRGEEIPPPNPPPQGHLLYSGVNPTTTTRAAQTTPTSPAAPTSPPSLPLSCPTLGHSKTLHTPH